MTMATSLHAGYCLSYMVSIINELLPVLSPSDFIMVISYFSNSKQHVPESITLDRGGETHRDHSDVMHADLIFVFMELLSLVLISYLGSGYELA